ncbi:sensor histidine kinase [Sphingomonas sp. ID0503]|uniref:sensor histidine kinase n=1 Tax=Sphingomonas sp. ID0503 TaxID=3399691 RepID=UPI003AFA046A
MPGRPRRFQERLPLARDAPVLAFGASAAIIALSALVRYALLPILPPGFPYLIFFPGIILSAFLFGRGPGILALGLAAILAWLFFIAPIDHYALPLGSAVSLVLFVLVNAFIITLVHWMQVANARLLKERERSHGLAETRTALFNELQHRVSNNLQVVAALLVLQKREIADEAARRAIDEASRRLALIGKIHRQLYDGTGRPAATDAFLRQLVDDVLDALGARGVVSTVEAEEDITLDNDSIVPVALIVAEAVANAVEHGFAGRDRGTIHVRVARGKAGRGVITVSDDGCGVSPSFDPATAGSLGLTIATALAQQIGGCFTLTGQDGACARLELPLA